MKLSIEKPINPLQAVLRVLDLSAEHRMANFEQRKSVFIRDFKILHKDERKELCEVLIDTIKNRFALDVGVDDLITMFSFGIAAERDWDSTLVFLELLLEKVTDGEQLKDIAIILLDLADNEITSEKHKLPLGQTALVLLTEMGLMLANRQGQTGLDYRAISGIVEYITTNLLARSNINDNSMRIALIQYLVRCPANHHYTMQLNRVMSRFGQSLLDELLRAYFEDKKRGNAAFYFLVQYLNVFFVSSPMLAEISLNVLKHYMLKYPDDFPAFLSSYCDKIPREELRLEVTTKCLALLLKGAVEISKKDLAENISQILIRHLKLFMDVSQEFTVSQVLIARQLLAIPNMKHLSACSVIDNFNDMTQELLGEKSKNYKIIPIGHAKKSRKNNASIKLAKVGDKPSPLETMLSLAS